MTVQTQRLPLALHPLIAEAKRRMRFRRSLLALGLLLLAGATVGGLFVLGPWGSGGNQAAVLQESKQVLGNGHPTILRIETVHDLGGNKLIVATLHGNFTFPPADGGPILQGGVPRARPQHNAPPTYVWLSFSTPGDMSGFQATSASQIAAITNAHGARPAFGIFPNSATTGILCAIPRGNSSATVPGHCNTTLLGSYAHPAAIRFHEGWGFGHRRDGGWSRSQRGGGWIVALDRNEQVRSIRRFGDLPPQLWK